MQLNLRNEVSSSTNVVRRSQLRTKLIAIMISKLKSRSKTWYKNEDCIERNYQAIEEMVTPGCGTRLGCMYPPQKLSISRNTCSERHVVAMMIWPLFGFPHANINKQTNKQTPTPTLVPLSQPLRTICLLLSQG